MHERSYARCLSGILALLAQQPIAYGVAVNENVAVTGQAIQEVVITLPDGTQQEAKTDDRNGSFYVTPERNTANVNVDSGPGLVLVTDKNTGAVVFGGIRTGQGFESTFPAPESDDDSSATALSESASVRVNVRRGDAAVSGAKVTITGLGGQRTSREGRTGSNGTARIDGVNVNFYRIDIEAPATGGGTTTETRYTVLRDDLAEINIDLDNPGKVVSQLTAWGVYFSKIGQNRGIQVVQAELAGQAAANNGAAIFDSLPAAAQGLAAGFRQRLAAATTRQEKLAVIDGASRALDEHVRQVEKLGWPIDQAAVDTLKEKLGELRDHINSSNFDPALEQSIRQARQNVRQGTLGATQTAQPAPGAGQAARPATGGSPASPLGFGGNGGNVYGTVVLADGSKIPGVLITIKGADNAVATTVSSEQGNFRFLDLRPGTYTITFELEGFQTRLRNLEVSRGGSSTLNQLLETSTLTEDIIVAGDVPTLDHDIRLPGVSPDQIGVTGTSDTGTTIWINDRPTDAVRAEFGHFTGGVINVITKSGGSEFSGSTDWFFGERRPLEDGTWLVSGYGKLNFHVGQSGEFHEFRGEAPTFYKDVDEIYQATVGGYVVKDKLWFFTAGREPGTPVSLVNQSNDPVQVRFFPSDFELGSGKELVFDAATGLWSLSVRDARVDPQNIRTGRYTGIPIPSLLAELQSSERAFTFGSGSSFRVPTDTTLGGPNPYDASAGFTPATSGNDRFFSEPQPGDRVPGSQSYFLDNAGSHDLTFGFEDFSTFSSGGTVPSDGAELIQREYEGLQLLGRYRLADRWNMRDYNRYYDWTYSVSPPGQSSTPGPGPGGIHDGSAGFIPQTLADTATPTQSLYVNDRWQLNDKWSFNIGFRYEDVRGDAGEQGSTIDPDAYVPRLAPSYDLKGDGKYRSDLSYAQYAGQYGRAGGGQDAVADQIFGPGGAGKGIVIPDADWDHFIRSFQPNDTVPMEFGASIKFQNNGILSLGTAGFGPGGQPLLVDNEVILDLNLAVEGAPPNAFPDGYRQEYPLIFNGEPFIRSYPIDNDTFGVSIGARFSRGGFLKSTYQSREFADFIEDFTNPVEVPGAYREILPNIFEIQQGAHGAVPEEPAPQMKALPRDAYFHAKGHAKDGVEDQWGLKRIGFKATDRKGKGALWPRQGTPVIVAVVDSGMDIGHPDLQRVLWANFKEVPNNRKDDDGNGLVDDIFGWNFTRFNNDIRDDNGHGTFVTGIIAANIDNGLGIAGINPWARIMPVKVSNFANDSNSVDIAMGISYAARMGARVINVSIAGKSISRAEQAAIKFANDRGALVVVAAGNDGANVKDYSPAGLDGVIVVTAVNSAGTRENYSNWGRVDIAAPGSDIVSLRAARTDLLQFELKDYQPGANVIGRDRLLYHTSGTSFAAPYVSGVASLLLSINPKLTAAQVKRMILHSARDIDEPGVDQFTGYGVLDAAAALKADPEFYIEAAIAGVGVVNKDGKPHVRVTGTADADRFKKAWIEIGQGDRPKSWKKVAKEIGKPVTGDTLGDIPAGELAGAKQWVLRVITEHKNGSKRENRFVLKLG